MASKRKTIAVVQGPGELGDQMMELLEEAGYRVRVCNGPMPPDYECWSRDFMDCPIWQQADLLIYDPWLPVDAQEQGSGPLIRLLKELHPLKPVLVCGTGAAIPSDIADHLSPGSLEFLSPDAIEEGRLLPIVERLIGSPKLEEGLTRTASRTR